MNVRYTFRPDSWKVFPPYLHRYEERVTTKSFAMRSRIFVYEYVVYLDNYIDWMQFVFYDEMGNELDDTSEMMENVTVYIKDPEHTLTYSHVDILQTITNMNEMIEMKCVYYWASLLNRSLPFLLHGIFYKNGNMKETVMIVYDVDVETSKVEDGYGIDHHVEFTDQCKRRIRYMLTWLNENG
jgi:hypothetical protein